MYMSPLSKGFVSVFSLLTFTSQDVPFQVQAVTLNMNSAQVGVNGIENVARRYKCN